MASLKDKKLSPTLFLLSGQDADVMMMMGAERGSYVASLLCTVWHVRHQLVLTGPFRLFSPRWQIPRKHIVRSGGGCTAAGTPFLCLFWLYETRL